MDSLIVNPEFFVLPREPGIFWLYLPLQGQILEVNSGVINTLKKLKEGKSIQGIDPGLINSFKRMGLLVPDSAAIPSPIDLQRDVAYMPTSVTLIPTYECNLRCTYCYSRAGEKAGEPMRWEIAKAAIDEVVHNAITKKESSFQVGFHGGGEPLIYFDLVRQVVEYTENQAAKFNLKSVISSATNGVLNQSKLEYIASHFDRIMISFDGPSQIHNQQRPRVGGQGSFDAVMESIKYFEEKHFSYGIRATVTKDHVSEMIDIVQFFCNISSVPRFHLEPLFECGRCVTTKVQSPEPDVFISNFITARALAQKKGRDLVYSGANVSSIIKYFCGATGSNFFVTPAGDITTCLELNRREDQYADLFNIGSFHTDSEKFIFDSDKISSLRKRTVSNMPGCSDCFAKFNCAGDCLAKILHTSGDMYDASQSPRCSVNQKLLLYQIKERMEG